MACHSFLLDFGMSRTGLSSTTSLDYLDFNCMSSDIFLSSVLTLGPVQSGPGLLSSLAPQYGLILNNVIKGG